MEGESGQTSLSTVCLGGLRDHKVMGMRYYEYLSSAKVDMLFPQIDRSTKVTGTEIGISVKVLTFSRKTNGQEPPSVYEKLAEVEDWIYAHGEPVGTVDEPAAWIYGRMRLGMTVVPKGWERRDSPQVPLDGTVLFAGDSGDGACLVMGGSARHLHDLNALPVANVEYRQAGSNANALGILLRCYPDFDGPVPPEEFAERPLQDRYHLIARPAKDILLAATGKGRRSPGGLDAAGGVRVPRQAAPDLHVREAHGVTGDSAVRRSHRLRLRIMTDWDAWTDFERTLTGQLRKSPTGSSICLILFHAPNGVDTPHGVNSSALIDLFIKIERNVIGVVFKATTKTTPPLSSAQTDALRNLGWGRKGWSLLALGCFPRRRTNADWKIFPDPMDVGFIAALRPLGGEHGRESCPGRCPGHDVRGRRRDAHAGARAPDTA